MTSPIPIGRTPRLLSKNINRQELYGSRKVKLDIAIRIASLAIVLNRSVEDD